MRIGLLIVILLCGVFACAQPAPTEMHLARGKAALAAGQFAEAEACYRAAIGEVAELPADDPRVAEPYLALMALYTRWAKPDEGEAAMGALVERLGGKEPSLPQVAARLLNVANGCTEHADFATAESLYLKALALYQRAFATSDSLRLLAVLEPLAELYRKQGNQQEKRQGVLTSICSLMGSNPDQHDNPRRADYLLEKARYAFGKLVDITNWREVSDVSGDITEALAIYEKAYGKDDPRLVDALHLLAAFNCTPFRKNYKSAKTVLLRALVIQERAYGNTDERLVPTMVLLALLQHRDLPDAKAVEQLLQRITAIYTHAGGGKDARAGQAHRVVGTLYLDLKAYRVAESHLRQALALDPPIEAAPAWDNAWLFYCLAQACHRQQKYPEAADYYLRALTVVDVLFDEGDYPHMLLPYLYEDAAACLRADGKPNAAQAIEARAAAAARRVWKDDCVKRLLFNAELASNHPERHADWADRAESYLRLALLVQAASSIPNDPDLADIRRKYAVFLRSVGRMREAKAVTAGL
jgi:tetratricopeptide (TPR) repeat protein